MLVLGTTEDVQWNDNICKQDSEGLCASDDGGAGGGGAGVCGAVVWESIDNLFKVVPEWGRRTRRGGRNLDCGGQMCVCLCSFIKALDVIAGACPLPENDIICGMCTPRCIRKGDKRGCARIGSVKYKAQRGWRKHCGSVGGVETDQKGMQPNDVLEEFHLSIAKKPTAFPQFEIP
jgi:hypothetical protein